MSKARVAYLSSEYPAISHTFILREIQSLRKQGIDVCTASIRPTEHLEKMGDVERNEAKSTYIIKTTAIPKVLFAHLRLLLKSPKAYWKMFREAFRIFRHNPARTKKAVGYLAEAGLLIDWMKRKDVKHVHVHFANPAATVAMIAQKYGTISFSLSIHGPDIFYDVENGLLKDKIQAALFVRSISHYCTSQVQRLIPFEQWNKVHLVRCGIDPQVFCRQKATDNSIPQILCVGRLTSAKGHHTLLQAAHSLCKQGVPFHLTFVGGGEDSESLQSLCSELGIDRYVTFTGPLGQSKVRDHYGKSDIFVLPSFAEGVPVVLMEAMASELGVVSTRITGIPELIDHKKDGILVPPADPQSLVKVLLELLQTPEKRRELAKAGRKKVLDLYDLDKNCLVMGDLFKKYLIS